MCDFFKNKNACFSCSFIRILMLLCGLRHDSNGINCIKFEINNIPGFNLLIFIPSSFYFFSKWKFPRTFWQFPPRTLRSRVGPGVRLAPRSARRSRRCADSRSGSWVTSALLPSPCSSTRVALRIPPRSPGM